MAKSVTWITSSALQLIHINSVVGQSAYRGHRLSLASGAFNTTSSGRSPMHKGSDVVFVSRARSSSRSCKPLCGFGVCGQQIALDEPVAGFKRIVFEPSARGTKAEGIAPFVHVAHKTFAADAR